MIQIFYGDGKGKTSILNGMAVRASGAGYRVSIYRFLKGKVTSEDEQLKKLGIHIKSFHHGEKFFFQMNNEEKELTRKTIINGLTKIICESENFDVIILDELLDLYDVNLNIVSVNELKIFLNKLADKELLLSGHTYSKELFEISDLVTKLTSEKHYYNKKIISRKGFEY